MQSKHLLPSHPSYVKITPDMAQDWLENRNKPLTREPNRRLSEHIAAKYARFMRDGRWHERSPQGISFDWDGYILDGQHRLRAIVLSGATIEMLVTPHCDPSSFGVLDNGFKRQAGQFIAGRYAAPRASAARIIAAVTGACDSEDKNSPIYAGMLSTDRVIEIEAEWPELAKYAPAASQCYSAVKISTSVHLAIIAMASRTRRSHKIDSWLEGLSTGAGLDNTDVRLLLRNRFIKEAYWLNGANNRKDAYNLIARAWSYYAMDRPVVTLKVPREDEGIVELPR